MSKHGKKKLHVLKGCYYFPVHYGIGALCPEIISSVDSHFSPQCEDVLYKLKIIEKKPIILDFVLFVDYSNTLFAQ